MLSFLVFKRIRGTTRDCGGFMDFCSGLLELLMFHSHHLMELTCRGGVQGSTVAQAQSPNSYLIAVD